MAKRAFELGVPPDQLAEWRILFAFIVFIALTLAFKRDDLRAVRRADLPLLALFGLLGVLAVQLVYYQAIQRIPIGVALVIEYTAPLLILGYWRLRGRRVGTGLWIAGALTVVGCYFVVGAYDAQLLQINTTGALLAAIDAVILAAYFLLTERLVTRYSSWALLCAGFGTAALAWSIARPPWTLPWSTLAGEIGWYVVGVVFIATVIPYLFSVGAVRLIPAARVGLASTAEPVIAAIAAWLLLGQSLEGLQVVGGAIVVVGILVAQSVRLAADSV
ncbi:MAG: EamA family transporter [Chloroflexota bacterium]|nr:EamA family transporter [Chloroflexota bacterium]